MRTYGVARALAANRGLTLLYVRFDAPEPDAAFRAIPGIELREIVPSRGLRRLISYGAARLARMPEEFARGISPELEREAARLAAEPDRGRVVADGLIEAAALRRLARARPVIYNAHNFESGFRDYLGRGLLGGARGLRALERGVLARSEESWMVSDADITAARELCPDARLRYVPNVVDVEAIRPVTPSAGERRAIFVANFAYAPNREGLRFLLERVFPRVWSELPDATLTLVGGGLEDPPQGDPRVQATGFVDDLAHAYGRASCAVVPLLQGGGTPLKFVEALAYAVPVIATRRAAAGLDVRDGEHCLLADGEEQFAAAVIRVLRDGAQDLGRHGRELAAERYSIEALGRLLAPSPAPVA
jgi:glycosyltransferase involved in cell wall biosynthesis